MRVSFLITFLFFGHLVIAQNNALDSLYLALKSHPQKDTVRLKIIFDICYQEYTLHPEKNKALANEALQISTNLNFAKGKGYAMRYLTQYYWTTGKYAEASRCGHEMLKHFESISYQKGIGQAYQLLGLINEEEGNFEKARDLRVKALQTYQEANLKSDEAYGYNSLGSLFFNFSKYEEAAIHFKKAMEIRAEINDEDGLSQSYGNLAHTYTIQKQYSKALEYFEKAINISKKLNNIYRVASDYAGIGQVYILTNKYDKAEFYLLKAIEQAKSIDRKRTLQKIYSQLTLLEKKRGKFENALKYFELESIYKDSIYTEEQGKQFAIAEAQYETEKKDQMIQVLEKNKKIQLLWTNILIVVILFLGILLVLIHYLQKNREQKNRMVLNLEIEQLTTHNKELSQKFKDVLASGNTKAIETVEQRFFKRAIDIIEYNIGNPSFDLEILSDELNMSKTNMHRKIKAITGLPPSELIRSIRLRKAASLLLNQADSVSQIGYTVGFIDHSYFTKSFKKHFGVTPSEYQQSKRN